jgi:hypothetical protein
VPGAAAETARSNVIDLVAALQESLALPDADQIRRHLRGRRLRRSERAPHEWRHRGPVFWPSRSPHPASARRQAALHAEDRKAVLVLFDKEVFVVIAYNVLLVCIYFAVGGACGLQADAEATAPAGLWFHPFHSMGKMLPFCRPTARRARRLGPVGHDPEFGDRRLMPVFDFAQDRVEILACNNRTGRLLWCPIAIPTISSAHGPCWLAPAVAVLGGKWRKGVDPGS